MLTLYRILFPLFLLVALPAQIQKMRRRGGYRAHFGMRFGRGWNLPAKSPATRRIWVQAVSVGEVNATRLLVEQLAVDAPNLQLVVTTTTSTGFGRLESIRSPNLIAFGYFPIDWWPCTRRAFRAIQPDAVALFEGEVWPEFLHQARVRGLPTCLLNARLSDRSFRRWSRFRIPARFLFGKIDRILAASVEDAARFHAILPHGEPAPPVVGNIKCDLPSLPSPTVDQLLDIGIELGIVAPTATVMPPILFGVSTWPGEEELLLRAFAALRRIHPELRLVLCPRHAERRAAVLESLRDCGHAYRFRTGYGASTNASALPHVPIAVLDTTGDLSRCIAIAAVAVVGKSFPPNAGGQSPLDPVRNRVPTVFGPAMNNFRMIAASMVDSGVAIRATSETLDEILCDLFANPERRAAMSASAGVWLESNRGAVSRTSTELIAAVC